MEYAELEPFGPHRDNFHAAMVATILANAFRGQNKAPVKMSEFFYKDQRSAQDEADAQMLAALREAKARGKSR